MAAIPESRTPHFGLRDFLFYLVPGFLILLTLALFADIDEATLSKFATIGGSVAAILIAYVIGQINYGCTYPLRRLIKVQTPWEETDPEFQKAYMWLIEKHPGYYTAEVFRYRNFARFSITMVVPSVSFGIAAAVRLRSYAPVWAFLAIVLAIVALCVFIVRYRHYTKRFLNQVFHCWSFDWKRHAELGKLAASNSEQAD